MNYFKLSLFYKQFLAAGFLLCFFSGLGQSFFISGYTGLFLDSLPVNQASFGLLYAAATLASGLLMPWLGSKLDHIDPRQYTFFVVIVFAMACFLLSGAHSLWQLGLALFAVRLCGQGLFSHISATVVAQGFSQYRGRALSLTGLGHPIAEATLPLLSVLLVTQIGWRYSWSFFGALLLFGFLPLVYFLLSGVREVPDDLVQRKARKLDKKRFPHFLKTKLFWIYVMGMILPGSILTGIFLYHSLMAQEQGWTMAWVAAGFMWFALAQVIFSLIGGVLVDRFGARSLFGIYLIPLAAGLFVLATRAPGLWVIPLYLFLAGMTAGLSSPIKTALWAEVFGLEQFASLRSWSSSLAVIGTASSPAILGILLERGFSIWQFTLVSGFVVLLYCAFYFVFNFKSSRV